MISELFGQMHEFTFSGTVHLSKLKRKSCFLACLQGRYQWFNMTCMTTLIL
jgi:hypothetical protein